MRPSDVKIDNRSRGTLGTHRQLIVGVKHEAGRDQQANANQGEEPSGLCSGVVHRPKRPSVVT